MGRIGQNWWHVVTSGKIVDPNRIFHGILVRVRMLRVGVRTERVMPDVITLPIDQRAHFFLFTLLGRVGGSAPCRMSSTLVGIFRVLTVA